MTENDSIALPLTSAQSAIWYAQHINPDVPFVIAQYVELRGRLDLDLLMHSYRQAYHELQVGVRIVEAGGYPHLVADPVAPAPVTVVDLRDDPASVDAAHGWMRADRDTAIDMYDEHLVVSHLIRCGDDHCFWYSRAHHIALDGYGAMRIVERTAELYAAATTDRTSAAFRAASPARLVDEDRSYTGSPRHRRDREFWSTQVADLPPSVGLADANARVTSPTATHLVGTPVPTSAPLGGRGLRSAARIVAAFAAFLAVSTETDDVVLTLPVSARTTALLRNSAGSVSNVLPLHIRNAASGSVATTVNNTESALAAMLRHQRFRREDIGRTFAAGAADPTHFGPIVNLMMFKQRVELADVTGRARVLTTGPIPDLAMNVYPGDSDSAPRIDFEANGAAYTADDVTAHHSRFMRFLGAFADADPATPVRDLELFAPGERSGYAPAQGDPALPAVTLDRLLTRSTKDHSSRTALISGTRRIGYHELDAWSSRLARELIDRNLGPEDVVAVAVPRSIESVVALWATAKAGITYLPVDPRHPTERVEYTLTDSGAGLGLTMAAERAGLPNTVSWLCLDDPVFEQHCARRETGPVRDLVRPLRPDNPAYVIYTSGSTGTPKGVIVTHSGLSDLADVIDEKYRIGPDSTVLHLASPTFDTEIVEVLAAGLAGATLVIAPTTSFGGHELGRLLRDEHVTHLLATPSALATVDPTDLGGVELVIAGGEPCPPALVRRWAPRRRMLNAYGPTETTCSVTLTEPLEPDAPVSIGGLMRGVHATVLDDRLRPLPPGVLGELHLGGDCLARGYHGRPALTATKFVAHPFGEPGSRMFRSGDHVRWTAGGTLEFRGRTDDQVKVRGLRIELGEIDAVLGEHPGVLSSTTMVHRRGSGESTQVGGSGESTLVAYVLVADPGLFDTTALLAHARRLLPDYMVPTAITALRTLPLTPTGKLDRRSLPAPHFGAAAVTYRAATSEVESAVAEAFSCVLSSADVGVDHSFFDLGGDSLSATRVISRVNDRCGVDLGVRDLFDAPTPAELATRVADAGGDGDGAGKRTRLGELPLPETIPLAPPQQYIVRSPTTPALYNIPFTARVRGPFDPTTFASAVADVLARHPSLRTMYPDSPRGPYQRVLEVSDVLPDVTPVMLGEYETTDLLRTGFDVRREPPFRIAVVENAPDDHTVACVVHHIAVDGWSMSKLSVDLVTAYAARTHGHAPQWEPPGILYADYTIWRLHTLGDESDPSSVASSQLGFWRDRLKGIRGPALPTDHRRPTEWTYAGDRVPFTLDAQLHRALVDVARTHKTGLFTALHSAVSTLTARLTMRSDVTVGTPVSRRCDAQLDDVVGMFVNTVVLRTHVSPTMTFPEVISHARETELRAFANADVQFERLVEVLDPPRSSSTHPFFQVAMSLENFGSALLEADGMSFEITPRPLDVAKCDLHFYFTETFGSDGTPNGIDAHVLYSTDLFDEATVRLFVKSLCEIVETAVAR